MLEKILELFKAFDANLTLIIKLFLKSYIPYENPPFFSSNITNFTKVIIYSLFLSVPIFAVKVFFPNKKIRKWLYLLLVASGLSLFGILLGFLQLLFY
ncbi:hypothetical protein A2714_01365 [Candidatus Woesebacteria bacterium RIFCSPHIGHO2_01_FULL_38_9]|uniref:Uncharacterized protein n=2 Tax=Candidatus Woeseibacteriota TaxID=1752722 RepID=A0A1F7Y0J3_9BACT|nr:MAG: hypothetical protein A2714_01365 [Candidatus Woesebacteria bacterium RIFCSPHIGHO2_01_FULL_38_9]OGM58838.1 MAG: hypothetical protein A3A75_06255 [Candidatus Woesebacteria bacterium RIFCSPLOWO2_01_FULL_39_10]